MVDSRYTVGVDNPFNGVDVGSYAKPTFVDVDNDGDMDAFVGNIGGKILHFKNTGSITNPSFVEQTGTDNPFNGVDVGGYAAPTFIDVENEMTIPTCHQHWSSSFVVWSRDIHGSTVRVEPLDDLEMTILTRDQH